MRAYDVALAVTRVLAATGLIQAAVTVVFMAIRIYVSLSASTHFITARYIAATELAQFTIPLEEAAWSLVFLIFGKSIFRFAAKLAPERA